MARAQIAQVTTYDEHDPGDDDDDDERDDDDDDSRAENPAPLEGLLIGSPFALATDCSLLRRNDAARVPGCCACIQCDACGQKFRVDLLSDAGMHACPKCKLEYTSMLIVATLDDHTILQQALQTILASNGITVGNPDEDLGDDEEGDDEPGDDDDGIGVGVNPIGRAHPDDEPR